MRFLFLLLGLAYSFGGFATNLIHSNFKVSSSLNSCYKNECVSHLIVTSDEMHQITGHPKILNSDIKVLASKCEEFKCDVMIRSSKDHETITILMPDSEVTQVLDYSYQRPAYYL